MVKSIFWTLSSVLISLALVGCAKQDPNGPRNHYLFDNFFPEDTYARTFDRNTQEARVHSELEPVLTGFATYLNRSMRTAYIHEMARQFRYAEERTKALAAEQILEDESSIVFIFSAATREPDWNDFEKQHSMWRLTLETPDGSLRVDPEKVEAISQKDETARYFWKHMDNFSRTYKVRFPRAPFQEIPEIWFRVTGTRGYLIFKFHRDQPLASYPPSSTGSTSTSKN